MLQYFNAVSEHGKIFGLAEIPRLGQSTFIYHLLDDLPCLNVDYPNLGISESPKFFP